MESYSQKINQRGVGEREGGWDGEGGVGERERVGRVGEREISEAREREISEDTFSGIFMFALILSISRSLWRRIGDPPSRS